jgi:hypothetical protein
LFTPVDAAPAQTKPEAADNFPLMGLSQAPAATLLPVHPVAAAAEASVAPVQPTIIGDGPVALALAAARESRHRRAAAVAAATATATAAAAAAAAAASAAASRSIAPIKSKGVTTTVPLLTPQEHTTASKASRNFAAGGGVVEQDTKTTISVVPSAGGGGNTDDSAAVAAAAAPDDIFKASLSKKAIDAPANDEAEGAPSAAADDGIILWSRMDRDKRVHLNDFLANRYGACARCVVSTPSHLTRCTSGCSSAQRRSTAQASSQSHATPFQSIANPPFAARSRPPAAAASSLLHMALIMTTPQYITHPHKALLQTVVASPFTWLHYLTTPCQWLCHAPFAELTRAGVALVLYLKGQRRLPSQLF